MTSRVTVSRPPYHPLPQVCTPCQRPLSLSRCPATLPACHPDACLLPHWWSLETVRLTDRVTHQPPNGLSKNTPNLWESSISTINILVLLLQIGPGTNLGICATKGFLNKYIYVMFSSCSFRHKNCCLDIILHPNLIINVKIDINSPLSLFLMHSKLLTLFFPIDTFYME